MRKVKLILVWMVVFSFAIAGQGLADVGPQAKDSPKATPPPSPVMPSVPPSQVTYTSTVTTTYEPADEQYMVGDKLARGFANVLTSPLEIPRNVQNVTEEQGILIGWTGGLCQGIGMMALRIIVGAYEIITFPIPFPEGYKPVITPEFVWQARGPKITPQGSPKTGA